MDTLKISGREKQSIYLDVKKWAASRMGLSSQSLQVDDKEAGLLLYKCNFQYDAAPFNPGTAYSGYISFVLEINVSDSICALSVSSMYHSATNSANSGGYFSNKKPDFSLLGGGKKKWERIQKDGYHKVFTMFLDIESYLKK